MNLDALTAGLSQISYAVTNLSKKLFKQSHGEIHHITAAHGQETERHLFRCLFSHIDFSTDNKGQSNKDVYQIQLLQNECESLISKPNCSSILCYAIENPLQHQKTLRPSPHLLPQISKILRLTKLQEVLFGIVLQNSANSDLRAHAKIFTNQKLPDLIKTFLDQDIGSQTSGLHEAQVEVIHTLLEHILEYDTIPDLKPELKEQFIATLKQDFPRERAPMILMPLLYDDQLNLNTEQLNPTSISLSKTVMETSLADCVREIGYACTSDKDRCRQTLTQLGGVREVTAPAVAQVLGMMAKTNEGLPEGMHVQTLNMPNSLWVSEQRPDGAYNQHGWNVEIFVQVIQELSPSLNWRDVVRGFDYPGFLISNKTGLQLVVMAVRKALHGGFPVEELYKLWDNTEGQLSWFVYALKNPEVFCFASFPSQQISLDVLKTLPDADNMDVGTWKIPDLVETLLKLSDKGHYQQVSELFKVPVSQFPDVLVLNLLQCSNETWGLLLKRELLMNLIHVFLNNHQNAAPVLMCTWNLQSPHVQTLRALVMQCLADWYMRPIEQGEQPREARLSERLSRILDVAQDLKALSNLLNSTQFSFIIELACLASRREYLKLDKWLNDKIRDHREPFIEALVMFLKRKCPMLMGNKDDMSMQQKQALSPDTIGTILAILHSITQAISSEDLQRDIATMVQHAGPILNKPRSVAPMPSAIMGMPGGQMDAPYNSMLGMNPPGMQASMPTSNMSAVGSLPDPPPTGSPAKFPPGASGPMPPGPGAIGAGPGPYNRPMHPNELMSRTMNNPAAQIRPQAPPTQSGNEPAFSDEVEETANSYFQKIYNQAPKPTISIPEILATLKQFKDSETSLERNIFTCMLRNLFDEKQFFPQYPERELLITAQLFGGIIDMGLIQHMALGMALKHVLEALQSEPSSKMFYFGLQALDRFKGRLKDLGPQYCSHIQQIPHYSQFPKPLIQYVQYGMNKQEPPHSANNLAVMPSLPQASQPATQPLSGMLTQPPPAAPPSTSSTPRQAGVIGLPTNKGKPSLAHTTNIDTLLAGADQKQEIVNPPENIQDKVFFIFNNLSQVNMSQKAEELLNALKNQFTAWCAQYLVMKRASIEPNFHPLYSSFLDHLDRHELTQRVLLETFRNIKVLLRSDKGISNFSDRALLKNLGHWLGLMTLAHNRPILSHDLNLKELLYEAFSRGSEELLYVVPFVAKVLESADKSIMFRPRNPWTMGILNVLAELHQQPELKLNLKFEVEVLCKNLHLEVAKLHPSNYLAVPNRHVEPQLTSRRKDEATIQSIVDQSGDPGMIHGMGMRPAQTATPELHPPQQPGVAPTQPMPPTQLQPTISMPSLVYGWNDININSLNHLAPLIQASDHIPLFQHNKNLKLLVKPALERTIGELLIPVIERTFKSVVNCVEILVKKDFSLDPEEQRMRTAAQHMARHVICGMALVTCREPLVVSLTNNLKTAFMNQLRGASNISKELIENAAAAICNDNAQLACAFICKAAAEKIMPEIDRKLAPEYDQRMDARSKGIRYCDPVELSFQEKLDEPIRLKPGAAPAAQMAVYEEFSKSLPGFASSSSANMGELLGQQHTPKSNVGVFAEEVTMMLDKLISDISPAVQSLVNKPSAASHKNQINALQHLVEVLKSASQRGIHDITASCLTVLSKTVDSLLEHYRDMSDPEIIQKFREIHLHILKSHREARAFGPAWTNKHVTRNVIDCREDYKFNDDAIELLIKSNYVIMQLYDICLAQNMENGLNYNAVSFTMKLVQTLVLDRKSSVTDTDLANTLDMLLRISQTGREAPEGLSTLLESIRAQYDTGLFPGAGSGTAMMQSGINQAKEANDDPKNLSEKTEYLLREWVSYYHSPLMTRDGNKLFNTFMSQMQSQGILRSDDLITRFIRLCTEMCVDVTYNTLKAANPTNPQSYNVMRTKSFQTLDAFVRLISLLVKLSGDHNQNQAKINLLNKVLGLIGGVLAQDHEARGLEFEQLPYHRILIMLYLELTSTPEPVLEALQLQVLTAYSNILRYLRPQKMPGFAFAWLEIVGHRMFVSRILSNTNGPHKTWNMYAQLLVDLFKFLAPFLRNADLNRATFSLYKATLRLLLLLIHDYPEFLADYHFHFCDVIPVNCIQMRNLILSAFPRVMRMPDPLMPNLKIDMISDMNHMPRKANIPLQINNEKFKKELDAYITGRAPASFPKSIKGYLLTNGGENVDRYNIPLINAVVLYLGMQAISYIQAKSQSVSVSTIDNSSHMDIFLSLALELDTEGRYLMLNAVANQLRFPNSHTNYFSCLTLHLFANSGNDKVKEQIARVLVERVTVNRPHPWGLLATFMELCRNTTYNFWNQKFIKVAPEIEALFENFTRISSSFHRSNTQNGQNITAEPAAQASQA